MSKIYESIYYKTSKKYCVTWMVVWTGKYSSYSI